MNKDKISSWIRPHTLRIGDEVIIVRSEFLQNPSHPELIGERGIITAFADKSICRWWEPQMKKKAGFYEDVVYPVVTFPDGSSRHIWTYMLELIDRRAYQERVRQLAATHSKYFPGIGSLGKYISPLPDTAICEGDIVRLKSGARQPTRAIAGWVMDNKDAFLVGWLSYRVPGDIVESRNQRPSFSLSDRFRRKMEDGWNEDELELVARGNFWREEHGQPLRFSGLEDAASFLCDTNRVQFVRSSKKVVAWGSLYAAMTQVKRGRGHGILRNKAFTGWSTNVWYRVVRFSDESLGNAIRNMTLGEGFLIPNREDE